MAWTEKWQPTPFDNQPIPGLLFLDGDLIARTQEPDLPPDWAAWCKGLKYPVIVFPSGVQASVSVKGGGQRLMVNILRQMELPVFDTRDSAFALAQTRLEKGWRVEKSGENALDLWLGNPTEYLRITYDSTQRILANMAFTSIEPSLTAEHLLSLKDQIVERFHQLPPEHQATIVLALLREVMEGSMGEWLRQAFSLLYPKGANLTK